jgi:hypothetical protein
VGGRVTRAALLIALALLLTAASAGAVDKPAGAAQKPPPKISSLAAEPVEAKAKSGEDVAVAKVPLLNPGRSADLTIAFQASSSKSVKLLGPKKVSIGPEITSVHVRLTGVKQLEEKAQGYVLILGGEEPVTQAVKITPAPQGSRDWAETIVVSTLIVFAVLFFGVLVAAGLSSKGKLGALSPGPSWSFSSWATTLTAVGALLATVVGDATLPDVPERLSKDTLTQLNLAFAVLLVVGPFVFQIFRAPSADASDQEAGLTGYNWALLFACSLTAAAVLGQILTLGMLGVELTEGTWQEAVRVATGLLALGALVYFRRTAWDLATTDWKKKAEAEAAAAAAMVQKVEIVKRPPDGEPRVDRKDAQATESEPPRLLIEPALEGRAPLRLQPQTWKMP